MGKMRGKGQGTWDRTTNSWRLKGKGISKSPRQLEDIFNERVPRTKEGSRPFWNRFLEAMDVASKAQQRQQSPQQMKIQCLEELIDQLASEGRDTKPFQEALDRAIAVPADDMDHADHLVLHPDFEPVVNLGTVVADDVTIAILNSLKPKPPPKKESFRLEADRYCESKHGHDKNTTRVPIELFLEATGDIGIKDITVQHYRDFLDRLKAKDTWNDDTKARHQRRVHTFLRQLRADHDLRLGFIDNKSYRLPIPDGKKVRW